jgi:hypothetical protein
VADDVGADVTYDEGAGKALSWPILSTEVGARPCDAACVTKAEAIVAQKLTQVRIMAQDEH